MISSGTELERLIWDHSNQINDIDSFLHSVDTGTVDTSKVYVAQKRQIKKSEIISSGFEPDFLAFNIPRRICFVIEVKDGDAFDTKKSEGEHNTLQEFSTHIAKKIPFSVETFICSFNAQTKSEIVEGLKRKFREDEVLTGKEFCSLIGIDFDKIVGMRLDDQPENLGYFVEKLLEIPEVMDIALAYLEEHKKIPRR